MKFYRAAPLNTIPPGQGDPVEPGGAVIAIRLADLVSPAGPAAPAGRTALVVAGTPRIRAGEQLVFVKVVAAAPAVVRATARCRPAGIRLITPGWAPWNSNSMSWPVPG